MISSTSLLIYFLTLYSLPGLTITLFSDNESTSDDIALTIRSNCGPTMGSCGNCWATNFPDLGYGICKAGYYQGCKCEMTCTGTNDYCNRHGCEGVNDPAGGLGSCGGGYYEGCPCL